MIPNSAHFELLSQQTSMLTVLTCAVKHGRRSDGHTAGQPPLLQATKPAGEEKIFFEAVYVLVTFLLAPFHQNLSLDSSPLLNSPVSTLEEGTVRDLLAAELCTTTSDQKEFVSNMWICLTCLYNQFSLPPPPSSLIRPSSLLPPPTARMNMYQLAVSSIFWPSLGGTMQLSGFSRMGLTFTPRTT